MISFTQAVPGIYRLEVPFSGIWTGVFLVTGPENYLIDSGADEGGVREVILPALEAAGLGPEDIAALLCTHCHGDYVGGHSALMAAGIPQAACFEGSQDKLRHPLKYSRAIRAAFPAHSPQAPKTLAGYEPGRLLKDGETLGGFLRLIHTPGHDTDTVCYLDERTGVLITGDSLQWDGTVTQGTALVMNLLGYMRSLEKLEALKPRGILAGHPYLPAGCEISGEDACQAALNQCRASMTRYHDFLEERWLAGQRDPAVLAAELIDHIGGARPEHLFLPLYTVTQQLQLMGYC